VVEGGGQLPQPDVWGSVVGLLELDVGGSDVELLELVVVGGDVELLQLELGGGGMAQLLQQGLGVVGQEQQLCVEGSGQLSVEESGGQLPQLGLGLAQLHLQQCSSSGVQQERAGWLGKTSSC
jgi:hypothetical protein